MRGFFFGTFLFIVFAIMFASQSMYNYHQEDNISMNIYNFTENYLLWNYTSQKPHIIDAIANNTGIRYDTIQSVRISNLIHKTVDWLGFVFFETSKWAIEFGYTHPEYDFEFFMHFVKYWLFAMLAIAASPIIVPLIALLYLLCIGVGKLYKKLMGLIFNDNNK